MDNILLKLYKSSKTILTTKDIALLWGETNKYNLNAKIAYYVKTKKLLRLKPGIFAKSKDYNKRELAVNIYSPSYISFETILRDNGVIFQHYDSIFVASYKTKEIKCGDGNFVYRKIKNTVLYNPKGLVFKEGHNEATKERAFLDMIYLFKGYYFDNLNSMDWEKCFDLVEMYKNKELIKRLNKYYKNYAK